jgi:hypothetical protein
VGIGDDHAAADIQNRLLRLVNQFGRCHHLLVMPGMA